MTSDCSQLCLPVFVPQGQAVPWLWHQMIVNQSQDQPGAAFQRQWHLGCCCSTEWPSLEGAIVTEPTRMSAVPTLALVVMSGCYLLSAGSQSVSTLPAWQLPWPLNSAALPPYCGSVVLSYHWYKSHALLTLIPTQRHAAMHYEAVSANSRSADILYSLHLPWSLVSHSAFPACHKCLHFCLLHT